MSLDQIRYFVAVAEEGHLGRAAKRLHISAPPLSRHIRSVEDEVGGELFERTARGMTLLPAGQELLDRARSILGALDEAIVVTRAQLQSAAGPPTSSSARVTDAVPSAG